MGNIRFSKSHEWVKFEAGFGIVGISDYAQSQLGDIVFIELKSPGTVLKAGAQAGTVESTKTASEIYSPVSGEVIEINSGLNNNPQWINESCYEKGWMLKIKLSDPRELDALMDEDAYQKYIETEAR